MVWCSKQADKQAALLKGNSVGAMPCRGLLIDPDKEGYIQDTCLYFYEQLLPSNGSRPLFELWLDGVRVSPSPLCFEFGL